MLWKLVLLGCRAAWRRQWLSGGVQEQQLAVALVGADRPASCPVMWTSDANQLLEGAASCMIHSLVSKQWLQRSAGL